MAVNFQTLKQQLESARRQLMAGRLAEAEATHVSILSLGFPDASDQTIAALESTLRLALDLAYAICQHSESCIHADQIEEGLRARQRAEELKVDIANLHERLGDEYLRLWDFANAIASYRSALRLSPGVESLEQKLRDAIEEESKPEQVLARCRAAVARSGGSAAAHLQLANALRAYRMLDEAIVEYRRVIELDPESIAACNNLAVALKDCGRVEEAIEALRRAAEMAPDSTVIQSNLLYTLNFHPADDKQAIVKAHGDWHARYAAPLADTLASYPNDRSSDRPLRIGYVSPDFRDHCQSCFTIPLFSSHDPAQVELYCYADVARPDACTDRLRGFSRVWRDTRGLSDERVAEMVRSDRIDILVDLTMHMVKNRQMVFARKPAPIQVTWLAYPGTTGQSAINYRISDPFLDPPGVGDADAAYTEQTVRLPETFWCFAPLQPPEPVSELPARRNGSVTFGCLNNFCKVNDRTLRMWSEVLRRVGDSHLMVLTPRGEARQRVLRILGVDEQRIEFVDYCPREVYLKLYHRIDICLDTFPYNGHTTSLDALWMGVPVISRFGQTAVSRAGFSQASNLNLTHLVGDSAEAFVEIAAALAGDRAQLAELRGGLRERMVASPLMDASRFARNLEALYRAVWQKRSWRTHIPGLA